MRSGRLALEALLGDFDGPEEASRLVEGLLVLHGWDAVGDDSGTSLDVGLVAFDDQGAEGDAGVHVAAVVDVADGSSIGSTAMGFELVDDLHGSNLRCSGDRAGGQAGSKGVEGIEAGSELAGDIRGDVHHVAVALDDHYIGDFDAAKAGDAADVVASEIDQHDVLRTFFGIGQKLFSEGTIFGFGGSAWTSSGEGSHGHFAIDDTAHDLGRTADESDLGHPQVEHEWAGVYDPQGAVDFERIAVDGELHALAQNDLKNIARADVVDALANGRFVRFLREIRGNRESDFSSCGWNIGDRQINGMGQFGDDCIDPLGGIGVGFERVGLFIEPRHRDDVKGFAHMIEDDHFVVECKRHVGEASIVGGSVGEVLDVANNVVAGIANGAASEGWQLGKMSRAKASEAATKFVEGLFAGEAFDLLATAVDGDVGAVGDDLQEGLGSDEAIAANFLATDHALEQAGVGADVQLLEHRNGGEGIAEQPPVDRD